MPSRPGRARPRGYSRTSSSGRSSRARSPDTGQAARRGEPIYFKSIYAYLIAPFWWIHSTAAAYSAIKYANAVLMSLAAVPSYLLARMLVSRRGAVIVALGSVAVPGMAYATSIVSDVLAYPYYALCSWVAVRALRSRRRLDVAIALVVLAGGYFVRQKQFTSLVLAFVLAAAGLWLAGPAPGSFAATGPAATRSARSSSRSAPCSSSTASCCSTSTSGSSRASTTRRGSSTSASRAGAS